MESYTIKLRAEQVALWRLIGRFRERQEAGRFRVPSLARRFAGHRGKRAFYRRIVSECAADVDEHVAIAGSEDETRSELERILPQFVLSVAGVFGARPRLGIVAPKEMHQVSRFQLGGAVGNAIGIDQQREGDACLLAKGASIVHVAKPDRRERGSGLLEFILVCAQLRDVLAAEDSAIVAEKDDDGRIRFPKRAQPELAASTFGQHNVCQFRAERLRHAQILQLWWLSSMLSLCSARAAHLTALRMKRVRWLRQKSRASTRAGALDSY